jgi:hypothetical protein
MTRRTKKNHQKLRMLVCDEQMCVEQKQDFLVLFSRLTEQKLVSLALDSLMPSSLPQPPFAPRLSPAVACIDHKLFVVGGYGDGMHCDDVHVFDFHTHAWSKLLSRLLTPRFLSAVVARDSHTLVVIGGYNNSSRYLSSVEMWSSSSSWSSPWKQLPSLSSPRAGCRAVMLKNNNSLLVLGGKNDKTLYLSSGEIFSFDSMAWSTFAYPMPTPRHAFGLSIASNKLFVLGGTKDKISTMEVFDLVTNEWTTLPTPCISTSATTVATYQNNKVFACMARHVWVLDCPTMSWTRLTQRQLTGIQPDCFVVSTSLCPWLPVHGLTNGSNGLIDDMI